MIPIPSEGEFENEQNLRSYASMIDIPDASQNLTHDSKRKLKLLRENISKIYELKERSNKIIAPNKQKGKYNIYLSFVIVVENRIEQEFNKNSTGKC